MPHILKHESLFFLITTPVSQRLLRKQRPQGQTRPSPNTASSTEKGDDDTTIATGSRKFCEVTDCQDRYSVRTPTDQGIAVKKGLVAARTLRSYGLPHALSR